MIPLALDRSVCRLRLTLSTLRCYCPRRNPRTMTLHLVNTARRVVAQSRRKQDNRCRVRTTRCGTQSVYGPSILQANAVGRVQEGTNGTWSEG